MSKTLTEPVLGGEIRALLIKCAAEITDVVRKAASVRDPEVYTQLEFDDGGGWSRVLKTRAPLREIRADELVKQTLLELDSLADLVEELLGTGLLSRETFCGDDDDAENEEVDRAIRDRLISMFFCYLRHSDHLAFDSDRLVQVFRAHLNGWNERRLPYRKQLILIGIEPKVASVEFGEDITLRRFGPDAKRDAFPRGGHHFYRNLSPSHFAHSRCYLELEYSYHKSKFSGEAREERQEKLSNALTALKLVQPGDFGVILNRTEPTVPWDEGGHTVSTGFVDHGADTIHPGAAIKAEYTLDEQAAEEAKTLYRAIRGIRSRDDVNLGLALRRFSSMYTRGRPADALLDGYIALETALIGRNEGSGALIERAASLATRAQPSFSQPTEKLHGIREIRNFIIHEGKPIDRRNRDIFDDMPFSGARVASKELLQLLRIVLREAVKSPEDIAGFLRADSGSEVGP